ncbi:hypothetical protein [Alkalibacillus haloalkaliphilus]|uniref:hypothetical protein n=1 Tax=Alkalibacillus haloalkaliphilus TaxID=94136 RepID=UPI0002E628F7|nr:hypothetical protein [Alkalibacillus haloalkaliphilus]
MPESENLQDEEVVQEEEEQETDGQEQDQLKEGQEAEELEEEQSSEDDFEEESGTTEESEMNDPYAEESISVIETDSGIIHIIHEISLGDILVFASLLMLLVFQVIKAIVRR